MYESVIRVIGSIISKPNDSRIYESMAVLDLMTDGAIGKMDSMIEDEQVRRLVDGLEAGFRPERIIGKAHFMGRIFLLDEDILIPTADTKGLVEYCISLLEMKHRIDGYGTRILDVGTGCGNIAISMALTCPWIEVLATDISDRAVRTTRRNIERFGMTDRVRILRSDLFEAFKDESHCEMFDMIVCNPPYIPSGSIAGLSRDVQMNQPRSAMDAGPYGIDIIRDLVKGSADHLRPGGDLIFEFGKGQEKMIDRLIERNPSFIKIHSGRYDEDIRFYHCRLEK